MCAYYVVGRLPYILVKDDNKWLTTNKYNR